MYSKASIFISKNCFLEKFCHALNYHSKGMDFISLATCNTYNEWTCIIHHNKLQVLTNKKFRLLESSFRLFIITLNKTCLIFSTFLTAGACQFNFFILQWDWVRAGREEKIMSKFCRIRGNLLEKEGLQRSRNRDTSDAKFQMRPND